jgi:hypothetical protein
MQVLIIEDRQNVPGSSGYLHYNLNKASGNLFNIKLLPFDENNRETEDLDIKIHNFIIKKLFPENPDCIILPCSLGSVHTNYLGIRLGCHIRLTAELDNNRYLPILFYSPDDLQDILRFESLARVIGTPGVYLVKDDLRQVQNLLNIGLHSINCSEYSLFLNLIKMDPPGSYYSEHSLANEWGAYRLDQLASTDQLKPVDLPALHSLYFKWLQANSSKEIIPIEVINSFKEEITTRQRHGLTNVDIDEKTRLLIERNIEISKKRKK